MNDEDAFHLRAAHGCLELGDFQSAFHELENIHSRERDSFDLLEFRWEIYTKAKKWEMAAEMAMGLGVIQPDNPLAWIHRTYALHELKRTQEA